VVIANPSDTPAATREAGVYLGMTVGEYYRDMGYDVVVVIDSISRWAEASREIENRLGAAATATSSLGGEGYPAYLSARLARCCERAGRVELLGGLGHDSDSDSDSDSEKAEKIPRRGSVTVVNSVSPEAGISDGGNSRGENSKGGNFAEPITQIIAQSSGAFWALDKESAQMRRFPAIDRSRSYSLYEETLEEAFIREAGEDWPDLKKYIRTVMERREELSGVLRRGGRDTLSEEDKWILYHAETLEIVYLQQNAYGAQDARSSPARMAAMLRLLKALDDEVKKALRKGLRCDDAAANSSRSEMLALRGLPEKSFRESKSKSESEGEGKAGREWLARFASELVPSAPAEGIVS
ncbi:MAG: hypothetical protein LBO68_02025, partial [Synergistaceae bacterium]|jgi:V/A-type H+-transporting ATPase subunit A|nr:hypothetical protein [Synergistaceae bacterium]